MLTTIYISTMSLGLCIYYNTNEAMHAKEPDTIVVNLFDHSRLIRGNEDRTKKSKYNIKRLYVYAGRVWCN